MSEYSRYKAPWWVSAIIILAMLPVVIYPFALPSMPEDSLGRTLIWIYPAYVLAAGICAWISYRQRPEVTWILIALLVLTHIGMYFL